MSGNAQFGLKSQNISQLGVAATLRNGKTTKFLEIKNRSKFVSGRWFCPPTRKKARVPRRKLVFCVFSTEPPARFRANRATRDLRSTVRVVL